MSRISLTGLRKAYGSTLVLEDLDLEIEHGELLVLLGPSGCGKTTTLRMIAGFIDPTAGRIVVGDRDLTHVPSYDRNIGVVFQNYALFPHLTVFENVAFGLRRRKVAENAVRAKVEAALGMVQMGQLAARMPRELSGGQQQRVAIARATVISPDVLLLDEPLSNLDAKLRLSIRQEIRRLQRALGITTIFVTHDQEEAMSIADRIVVMQSGRVQQVGAPDQVYAAPANRFVAEFIGGANFIEGVVAADGLFRSLSGLELATGLIDAACRSVVIRPEAASLSRGETPSGDNVFPAEVRVRTYLGAGALFDVRLQSGDTMSVFVGSGGAPDEMEALRTVREVFVRIPPYAVRGILT